jgi:cytochrome c-type biogenesis protein CcmH/NrfG
MSDPLLSAAMIVRDEAAHLSACLASIRTLVDEIVVVDTGSSDETVSIARSFGARVRLHPWQGSFAEARNVALDMARGRWILYIDADERLRPCSVELARARIANATEVALRVRLRPFVGATPYWEFRLWRADPRIRFAGVIHENMVPAIQAVAAEDGLTIGETELLLEHVGYEGDQTHKHERNLPMLRAQLAAEPGNTYNWHHLAVVLNGLGKADESEAALVRAVDAARGNASGPGMQAFVRLVCLRRERGEDTSELLTEGLRRYPDNFGLIWLKLITEIEEGRYEQALRRLELFDVDTEMPVEDIVGYLSELFEARTAEARGLCLLKLGRYEEAAAAYAEAERLEPAEPTHRLKRALAEAWAVRQSTGAPTPTRRTPTDGFRWAARELLAGFTVDIGGVPVELRATDAMRAAAAHSLLGRMDPSSAGPVAVFTFGRHRTAPPGRRPDDGVGPLKLWNDDSAFSITYRDSLGGRVEANRARLGGHVADLSRAFRYVAPFMLASLLAPHERFLLHAGAIARDGEAVLVLGATGSGKSTLVLAALQDGWTVLADDLVTVSLGPRGPSVSGMPRPLVVPAEVVQRAAPVQDAQTDAKRTRVELAFDAWDRSAYPIAAIIVTGRGQRPDAVLEPTERPDLLGILIQSMLSQQRHNIRRYMTAAATMCDLPAWRLLHSSVPEIRLTQVAQALRTVSRRDASVSAEYSYCRYSKRPQPLRPTG